MTGLDDIKETVVNLALLGASPSAIAYKLSKDGFSVTPQQVAELMEKWSFDIEMERELRTVMAKQTISDIVARLEKNMPLLEQILNTTMEKKHSKTSIEAIKEMNSLLAKIYELIAELKAKEEAEKLYLMAKDTKSLYKLVVDNFPLVAPLIPDNVLEKAGLTRIKKEAVVDENQNE